MRSWDTDFNPLPRKEGDCQHKKVLFIVGISIHSLVKRETLSKFAGVLQRNISIHSLVKRETFHEFDSRNISLISIHSLVKRETVFHSQNLLNTM